ncbi:MAG TPA: cysteine hydrolase [Candidatus Acidoferrum sp.]|jgi:nicotinamidase-related amidase
MMASSLPPIYTDAGRTALLVYDMQRGIVKQISDAERIVSACKTAIDAARRAGMRIAYSKHMSLPRMWLGSTQLRTAMGWQRVQRPEDVKSWFPRGSEASEIVPELAPSDDDLISEKFAMSAFSGTSLEFALRDCGIVNLVIVGIALEIGIEPTVRSATDLGFVPVVLTDACGFGDQTAGERAIETMKFVGEAILTDTKTFAAGLAANSRQA